MKSRMWLALDLGHRTFKRVLFERDGPHLHLLQVRVVELPPQPDAAARQAALTQLLEGVPVSPGMPVVSVVDDPFACVQPLRVPSMPPAELLGAATWELQRHLAVSPDEAIVDYQVVGEVEQAGAKQLTLLAAAVPKTSVRDHLAVLAAAGLTPVHLIPMASAVAAWCGRDARAAAGDAPLAVLLIGDQASALLVVQGGRPLFARTLPVAGGEITRAMTSVLMTAQGQVGFDEAAAETIKRAVGIPAPEMASVGQGVSGVQLLSLIRPLLERLADEAERSLAFYGESTAGTGVAELLLVGGGAHLKGLAEWLHRRLEIPVRVPAPLEGLPVPAGALDAASTAMPLSLVPVLGAALSAGLGLNLLPRELRMAAQTRVKRSALTGATTALLVGLILLRIGLGLYHATLVKEIAACEVERHAMAAEGSQARVALAVQQQVAQEPLWEEWFKELSHVVPREVYLTGLRLTGRELVVQGRVRELGRPADVVLAEWVRTLNQGMVTDVMVKSTRRLDQPAGETEFDLGCRLK